MTEFQLIEKYFRFSNNNAENIDRIRVPSGDDAAILQFSGLNMRCYSCLSQFDPDAATQAIRIKCESAINQLVNQSLAAQAQPLWLILNLVIESENIKFLQTLSAAVQTCLETYKIALIGGDTTRGNTQVVFTLISEHNSA